MTREAGPEAELESSWAAWRAAEEAIGDREAVDRAARGLPPRLGWLLRALEAVDGGSPEDLQALAKAATAAGFDGVGAVLWIAATRPDELDPAEVRRAAKRREAPGDALPMPDLLRDLALVARGEHGRGSKPLREFARSRPVLHATLHLLGSKASQLFTHPAVRRRSPRADQVVVLGRAHREGTTVDLERAFGRSHLSPERWGRGADDVGASPEARELADRLAGRHPWHSGHDPISEWLYARPAAEKRAWLGRIVRAIAARVPAGRWAGLEGAAHAGMHLAHGDPALRDLAGQLSALDTRLIWLRDGLDPESAAGCWEAVTDDEKTALAAELVRALVAPPGALAWLLARTPDLRAIDELLVQLPGVSRDALAQLLGAAGADPARRALVLACHAATEGRAQPVAHAMLALVGEGRLEDACYVASCFRVTGHHSRSDRRATARALAALIAAGPSPSSLRAALERTTWAELDIPTLDAADRVLSAGAWEDRVVGRMLLGREEAARQAVVEIGRELRRLEPGAATERALRVVAHVGRGEDPPWPVVEPLTAFLLRDRGAAALAAARGWPDRSPERAGVVGWALHHRDRIALLEGWPELFAATLSPPGAPLSDLAPLVAEALQAGVRTLPDLVGRVIVPFFEDAMVEDGLSLMDELDDQDLPF